MQIAGMICEYNPFHLGHLALVEETRRQGATHIAAVMSGNYVQRGEPALLESVCGPSKRCAAAWILWWNSRFPGP